MKLDVNSSGKMEVNVNAAHIYHHVTVDILPGSGGSPVVPCGLLLILLIVLFGRKKA